MTQLSQIVAVVMAVKTAVNKETAPLFHAAKNAELFTGITKTYEPIAEDGERLPDDNKQMQRTVPGLLAAFRKPSIRLLDTIATQETGNMAARANVVVDGVEVIPEVPVVFLLQLEKFLEQEVRGLVSSLPILDPAQEWSPSATGAAGVWETPVIQRHRTKKTPRVIVLHEPTKEHPAQTQLINDDVIAGYWSEKKFSGALTAQAKQDLIDRLDKLLEAVKFAREKANTLEIENVEVAEGIFGYLLP